MKIVTENDEFFKVIDVLARPKSVIHIATYNLFSGVLDDGRYTNDWKNEKWRNRVGEWLDLVHARDTTVNIKIGKPLFKGCQMDENPQCALHRQEEKWDGRLNQMDKRWPKFTFKIVGLSHVKLILFKHENGDVYSVYGGRNLTDAPLTDISFIDTKQEMYDRLMQVYDQIR